MNRDFAITRGMCVLLGLSLLMPLGALPVAAALIADSEADFGGTQGLNGWQYGYYPTDAVTGIFATASMSYSGTGWQGPHTYSTPIIDVTFMHPADGSGQNTPVRRYTIGATGEEAINTSMPVHITGRFWDTQSGGGNVIAFVTVDGVNQWSYNAFEDSTRSSTPAVFDLYVSVLPGSTIDFGLNRNGDYGYDGHAMAATIEATLIPEPASLVLAVAGMLACARRRAP